MLVIPGFKNRSQKRSLTPVKNALFAAKNRKNQELSGYHAD
jgi:hypothetical protein